MTDNYICLWWHTISLPMVFRLLFAAKKLGNKKAMTTKVTASLLIASMFTTNSICCNGESSTSVNLTDKFTLFEPV